MLQVDGNVSPLSISPDPYSPVLPVLSGPPPTQPSFALSGTSSRVRTASYTLDRGKQTARLIRDTTVQDFTIVVNSNKENVNINCNVGFYSKVAVPAIQHLAAKQVFESQGITVTCQDIVGNFDATNAQQNTVIHFRLSKDKHSLEGGSVRIHLHHTTRKVQIQGGALLPGDKKAPVWFVENILENVFTQLSQEKSLDIQQLNQAVNDMKNKNMTTLCAGCHGQFNGRSSPAFCSECGSYYHKFKCFSTTKHPCHIKKRSQSCTVLPEQPTSITQSMAGTATPTHLISNMRQHQVTAPTQPAGSMSLSSTLSLCFASSTSVAASSLSSTTTMSSLSVRPRTTDMLLVTQNAMSAATPDQDSNVHPHSTSPVYRTHTSPTQSAPVRTPLPAHTMSGATTSLSCSQAAMPSSLTFSQAVIPMSSAAPPTQALNPRAPLFVSNQPSLHPPKKATTGPKKKAKQVPSTDPAGLESEYNKYAINIAKTKICEQETELKDLKFRNKILEDRIAALEKKKKQEVHDDILSPTTQTCRAKLPGGCSQTSHSCCHSTSAHCCSSRAALPPCSINIESQNC